jgi:hypothetical protein
MRETFSTKTNKDDLTSKREKLQSQAKPPTGNTLDGIKPQPRKPIDELNQTMQMTTERKFAETIEVGPVP